MRALITGGAGHIGSHLVDRLVEEGYGVTVIDDLSTGSTNNLYASSADIEFVQADISQGIPVRDYDYIFHFAAFAGVRDGELHKNKMKVNSANVVGTKTVIDLAKEVNAKLIYAGSSSTFGEARYIPMDEEHPQTPQSVYAKSKLIAEQLILDSGLNYVILRFFNVYGGRMRENVVIPIFTERARRGDDLFCFGNRIRDFTHISDTVEGIMKAMHTENQIFNLGSGKGYSIQWLARKIAEKHNSNSEIVVDNPLKIDPEVTLADSTKARKQLNWKPKTSLEEWLDAG